MWTLILKPELPSWCSCSMGTWSWESYPAFGEPSLSRNRRNVARCLVNPEQPCGCSHIIGAVFWILLSLGIWLCFLCLVFTPAFGGWGHSHSRGYTLFRSLCPPERCSPGSTVVEPPLLSQKWYWCGCLFTSLPWGLLSWRTHFISHRQLGELCSSGFSLSLQGGSLFISRRKALCVMWPVHTAWLSSPARSFLFLC